MRYPLPRPTGNLLHTLALLTLLFALGACGDLATALPARPSPVPTLARLPSVTPVTPSPTREPTATPLVVATPSPVPLLAAVTNNANVRAGPGTDFAIVGVLNQGSQVQLRSRSGGWFEIVGPDGLAGWMSGQVLAIDAATEAAVPEATP